MNQRQLTEKQLIEGALRKKKENNDKDLIQWFLDNKIPVPKSMVYGESYNKVKQLKTEIGKKGSSLLERETSDKDVEKKAIESFIDKDKKAENSETKPKTTEEKQKEEQEYLDKLMKLHEDKMKAFKEQIRKGDLVPTDKEFIQLIRLQQEIIRGQSRFEKEHGKEELSKLLNKNAKEENKQQVTILEEHQKKIDQLENLGKQLDDKLERIAILEYQYVNKQISEKNYELEKGNIQKEKIEVLIDINELDPAMLAKEEETLAKNKEFEEAVLGQSVVKQDKEHLNAPNLEDTKHISKVEKNQEEAVKESNEEMDKSHETAITNKEIMIDDMKTKIINSKEETETMSMVEQIVKLEQEKDVLSEQKEILTEKKEVSNFEIENPEKVEPDISSEIKEEMENFKIAVETNEDLKENIEQEEVGNDDFEFNLEKTVEPKGTSIKTAPSKDNEFVEKLRNSVVDIKSNDPKDLEEAKKYLQSLEEITNEAENQNKELSTQTKEEQTDAPVLK